LKGNNRGIIDILYIYIYIYLLMIGRTEGKHEKAPIVGVCLKSKRPLSKASWKN
jgi:hypothetical protein